MNKPNTKTLSEQQLQRREEVLSRPVPVLLRNPSPIQTDSRAEAAGLSLASVVGQYAVHDLDDMLDHIVTRANNAAYRSAVIAKAKRRGANDEGGY